MPIICCLAMTDDFPVGRFDEFSLSDQSLIELLISGFPSSKKYRDQNGDVLEITSMQGIECNADGQVETLDISYTRHKGSLDMRWLPPKTKRADFYGGDFKGVYDSALIPSSMKFLRLSANSLEGNLDLTILPTSLRFLSLSRNSITGTLNFASLSDNLQSLDVADNKICGTLNLRKVSKAIYLDAAQAYNLRFWEDHDIEFLENRICMNLARNCFVENVLVHSIEKIESTLSFAENKCEFIVDELEQTRRIADN
uniref:Leucine-rich repeat protein n=1 Tax=Paramoeba aestuarina TaxID=180227 RepID=A0A7S4KVK1_9EUKA|mmetsp:Transcript_26437/g.41146  ORF Transcript_26437/g.41146 Transcript_26437/m.41146 type:complete len:255 (+) Transcript_26437:113-877(+)